MPGGGATATTDDVSLVFRPSASNFYSCNKTESYSCSDAFLACKSRRYNGVVSLVFSSSLLLSKSNPLK